MKNLKKLSVVLMITTLFSASFTSCIDNEVSPVVEAIYEAQADLIAAQSTVQNAQAALLLAQADAEQAQATLLLAQADAAADLAEGQLAALLAQAGLTDAQAALIMAQSVSLADLTAAQVTALIAEAGLTDAQAAMIMAQATALADLTAAQVIGLIADAGLTDAQAALVMAEAAALADMTEAEVAALMAEAGLTEARMLRIMAEIARYEAESVFMAAKNDQELLLLVAETSRKVAAQQYRLELAEIQFDIDMNKLMDELAAQNAGLAVKYAAKYTWAMQQVNNLQSTKLQKENWVATQELLLANSALTLQTALAAFQQTIDVKTAEIATKQAAIVDYQSIIDDPASLETRVTELQEETTMLRAENDALAIEIVELENDIQDLYNEYNASFDMEIEYETKYDFLMDRMDEKQDLVDENEDWADDIEDIQAALATYDATTTTLEQALTDAQGVLSTEEGILADLQTALDTAKGLRDQAVIDSDDADQDVIDAQTALTTLEGEINGLYATLVAATTVYTSAQTTYDAGLPGVTLALSTASTDYNTAETNLGTSADATLGTAWGDYNVWKANYEASPSGYTWFDDNTAGTTFAGGILGIQDNTTNANMTSYVEILTWTPVTATTWAPLTYGTPIAAIPADVVDDPLTLADETVDNREWLQTYGTATTTQLQTEVFFVEVGFDDTAVSNEQLLDDAIAALGDDNIFDTPPALPSTWTSTSDVTTLYLSGTDAFTVLYNAELDLLHAQYVFDNYETDLIAAKAEYERLRDIYENQLDLLDAAQQLVVDMQDLANTAQGAEDDAEDDVLTARQARNEQRDVVVPAAQQDVDDAQTALDTWLATTEAEWMEQIADLEANIAANDVFIAEYDIIIAKAQSEVDELQAEYDAALATPYRAQLLVDIYELYDMIWAKEGQIQANGVQIRQNRDIAIAMFGAIRDIVNHEDLMDMISDCNDAIAVLQGEIVTIEAQMAAAIATDEVDAANWQAWIDLAIDTIADLDAEIANYMAIADEYYGLMTAALED